MFLPELEAKRWGRIEKTTNQRHSNDHIKVNWATIEGGSWKVASAMTLVLAPVSLLHSAILAGVYCFWSMCLSVCLSVDLSVDLSVCLDFSVLSSVRIAP